MARVGGQTKYFLIGALSVLVAAAVGGLLVLWSGIISASSLWDGGALDSLLGYASRRSIARHATEEANPYVDDERARGVGLEHYKANCVVCHGAPGLDRSEFAKGLNPPAPELTAPRTQGMSDGELFWVVSNGIRMTGMPAFSPTHDKDEIWKIVAFVRHQSELTDAEKAMLREGREDEGEHHHARGAVATDETGEGASHQHEDEMGQEGGAAHEHGGGQESGAAESKATGAPHDHQAGEHAEGTSIQTAPNESDVIHAQMPSYPLTTCVVSGDELGVNGEPIDVVLEGRLVRLCSEACLKDLQQDPQAALKKIDAAVIEAQKPTYPMNSDPVTGEALGPDAVDYVHGTRLVRLARQDSVPLFLRDPKLYLAQVDKALIEAQRPNYPLTTCIVTGERLGERGEPIDYVYGTRLIRFCCKECPAKFEQDPEQYLPTLDGAKEASKQ